MACEKKTYTEITETVMAGIRRGLTAMDMPMPDTNQGTIQSAAYNVTAAYDFQPGPQTLTVEVTQKPFFVPCVYIYQKVGEAVEKARTHA